MIFFEIIQTGEGIGLEYMTNGLELDDYIFRRENWSYSLTEGDSRFFTLWYNAMDMLLSKKGNTGYFAINDCRDTEIGFIDDIPSEGDLFGAKLYEENYLCDRDGDRFIIYQNKNIIACIKRCVENGIDNYDVLCRDDSKLRIVMLMALYIDMKWFSTERTEVLKSIVDKGLLEETRGYRIPFIQRFKAWREFDARRKKMVSQH